jgi:N6-adenosine-specific RNA methylase IME4/ParB-like chromosome segregation protein Spo0J
MSTITMAIVSIKVGTRHRRDMGDIASLARTIADVGLLHPIVVKPDGTLIAGARRLAAFKQLGRTEIPVTVVDLDNIVRGELAENAERKDFLPSEIEAIRRALAPIEKAAAKERMAVGGGDQRGADRVGKISTPDTGKTRDKIGAFAGVSGRTVEKIADVVAAAEAEPAKFSHLVDEMDRTGKVSGAHRKLKQAMDERRVLGLVPVVGKFRTIVVDPPWDYEWLSLAGRAAPGYSTMSHEELLAMAGQFERWSEDNCHLYLWTTNNFITRAVELMARWGFRHKTVLTWVKPKWGLGSYFRNQSEHVLFGVRGELRTRSDSIATIFEAPLGEHSEKPERFYEIVRAASYPSGRYFGEVFQRQVRPDFKNLFENGDDVVVVVSPPPQTATITPLKPTGRVKWLTMELWEAEHHDAELEADDDPEFGTTRLTVDGRTLAISAWARETNIHPAVLRARIKSGWHPDWILVPLPGMTYWTEMTAEVRREGAAAGLSNPPPPAA